MKLLAANKRGRYDYQIEDKLVDKLVAGLVLSGPEVKSIKAGHISLKGSFISLKDSEAYLNNAHVTPYANSSSPQDPTRPRKLLMHRRQLEHLLSGQTSGLRAVPLAVMLDRNLVKLEIGLGRGKKNYDKRETIKKRQTERDLARRVKG
jgi:SsrA-binding protein